VPLDCEVPLKVFLPPRCRRKLRPPGEPRAHPTASGAAAARHGPLAREILPTRRPGRRAAESGHTRAAAARRSD